DQYNPELFTEVVSTVLNGKKPAVVLGSSSSLGRDLFARVAARLNTGTISDCTELEITGAGDVTVRRPMYAGKCTAEVGFENSPVKIVLMRPNQLTVVAPTAAKTPQIEELKAPVKDLRTVVKEVVKGATGKLDLSEANVIVSGGRGMKEAANFKILEELAEV